VNIYEKFLELKKDTTGRETVHCIISGETYRNVLEIPLKMANESSNLAEYRIVEMLNIEDYSKKVGKDRATIHRWLNKDLLYFELTPSGRKMITGAKNHNG